MSSIVTRRRQISPANVDSGCLKVTVETGSGAQELIVRDLHVEQDSKGRFWCDLPHAPLGNRLALLVKDPATAVRGNKNPRQVQKELHEIERNDLGFALLGATGVLVGVALGQLSTLRKWGRCHNMHDATMRGDCYFDSYVALATFLVAGGTAIATTARAVFAWKGKILEEAKTEETQQRSTPDDLRANDAALSPPLRQASGLGNELTEIRTERPGGSGRNGAGPSNPNEPWVEEREATMEEALAMRGTMPNYVDVVTKVGPLGSIRMMTQITHFPKVKGMSQS